MRGVLNTEGPGSTKRRSEPEMALSGPILCDSPLLTEPHCLNHDFPSSATHRVFQRVSCEEPFRLHQNSNSFKREIVNQNSFLPYHAHIMHTYFSGMYFHVCSPKNKLQDEDCSIFFPQYKLHL